MDAGGALVTTTQDLADAIVSVLRLAPGQWDVKLTIVEAPPPHVEPLVRFDVQRLNYDDALPLEDAWAVLDVVLARVPPRWTQRRFGSTPEHDSLDLPFGLDLSGEVWARYGDARGVCTFRNGATRWREAEGDPGLEQRMATARERFPDVDFGDVSTWSFRDR